MGRWGRYALYWDAGQNTVQVGRDSYDIYENGLNWTNGLPGGGLLGDSSPTRQGRSTTGSDRVLTEDNLVPVGGA